MDSSREGGRAAESRPIALLETHGIACGYLLSDPPAADGGEVPREWTEVLDDALRIAFVVICVVGTFALSYCAVSVIVRW